MVKDGQSRAVVDVKDVFRKILSENWRFEKMTVDELWRRHLVGIANKKFLDRSIFSHNNQLTKLISN